MPEKKDKLQRIQELETEIEERARAYTELMGEVERLLDIIETLERRALAAEGEVGRTREHIVQIGRAMRFARKVAQIIPSTDSVLFRGALRDLQNQISAYDRWAMVAVREYFPLENPDA